ncbi:hypothetical protein VNO77_32475 [Canavalia gladiata]|uniref:Uncharacterized protein n=1 Tax=Canavalia gladiata TaxID=3824 RepID=A0AAN9KRV5_CANGL
MLVLMRHPNKPSLHWHQRLKSYGIEYCDILLAVYQKNCNTKEAYHVCLDDDVSRDCNRVGRDCGGSWIGQEIQIAKL